jgi:hypothetical protein
LDATDTATIRLQFHDEMEEEIDEKSAEQSNKAPMQHLRPSREGGRWTVEGESGGGKDEE